MKDEAYFLISCLEPARAPVGQKRGTFGQGDGNNYSFETLMLPPGGTRLASWKRPVLGKPCKSFHCAVRPAKSFFTGEELDMGKRVPYGS